MTPLTLNADQRRERAKIAAAARWGSRFNWDDCDIKDGLEHLAKLRAESERGGLILQQRLSSQQIRYVECYNPDCWQKGADGKVVEPRKRTVIDVSGGRFAGYRTRNNPETGLQESAYACSSACYLYLGSHFTHFSASPRDVTAAHAEPDVVTNEAAKNLIGG